MIFVLIDDLRFDGMGFLQPKVKTPNIDKLAKDGISFPNAVVTSSNSGNDHWSGNKSNLKMFINNE